MPNRRNLVVLRAGPQSLHPEWLEGQHRDFDILVSSYSKDPENYAQTADFYEHRAGPKWSCIHQLLSENAEVLDVYDAFWFPDDDLRTDAAAINRMFGIFNGLGLSLAQPSLTSDSYYSWKFLLQRPEYVLRHSRFVEVMAPIFSRSALRACMSTFGESKSGWGLDWIWPVVLRDEVRNKKVAVIDAVAVQHTRPVKGGDLYKNNPQLNPQVEEEELLDNYGLRSVRNVLKYEAITSALGGRPLPWLERIELLIRKRGSQIDRGFRRVK